MSENDTPPGYTIDTLRGRLDLVPKADYDAMVEALREILDEVEDDGSLMVCGAIARAALESTSGK